MSSRPNDVRNAGLVERFHITLCDLGCDTCVVTFARYSTNSGLVLDRPTVLLALKHMILAHPALGVQIAGKHDKRPHFYRLPTVDLNSVLVYTTDLTDSLEAVVTSELTRPFTRGDNSPLWRALVRSDNTVIFSWHHAIGDGTCAHSFHAAFLSALNRSLASEGDKSPIVDIPASHNLTLPIEQSVNVSMSFKSFCRTIYEVLAPVSWKPLQKAWTGNPVASEPHVQVEVRLRQIEASAAQRLLALCREHKCTLTAFLHTLATLVLSHQLSASKDAEALLKRYKTFSTITPISLRRFSGVSPFEWCDQVSNYIAYPDITRDIEPYPPTKTSFAWGSAVAFGTSLHGHFKASLQLIGSAKYLYKLGLSEKYFLDTLGKKRHGTFVLSNIGAMPSVPGTEEAQQEDGTIWQVDDVCFGQNDAVFGSAIKMNMAGSPSGAINIAYTWGEGAIGVEFAEAFITDMHAAIASILST
ncbi:hypothetical protein BDW22DRAFT_1486019 [Trametopsis cervina]|nr:hypothetical protein BDW22DRAFT_1486019 [Trametopsis cervina]